MKFVKAGQFIKIENKDKILLESTIKKVEFDRLHIICERNSFSNFEEGDEISCTLFTNFGVRAFKSLVIDINNDIVIDFNPNDMEIVYKREFIRVEENLPAKIYFEEKTVSVITKDIGGGGIKFCTDNILDLDIICEFSVSLNSNDNPIKIPGKILKYDYLKENEYIFHFVDINENVRSKIIKKCLDIQAIQVRETLSDYE